MNTRTIYLVLSVLGFALPYSQFVPWVMVHGLDVSLFFRELFSTHIGGFFGMDVIVSASVLVLFIFIEGRRLGMKKLWAPVLGSFLIGVSFGFPLFLYMRHPYTLKPNNRLEGTRHKSPRPSSEALGFMKSSKGDLLIAAGLFSLAWAGSVLVFPWLQLLFAGVALISAFFHLVMLGFMRMDDIEPEYKAQDYVRDHAYSLCGSGLLFLFVAGVVWLLCVGHA